MGMVTLSKRENVEVFPFNSCRVFRQNSVIPQARSTTIALPVTSQKANSKSDLTPKPEQKTTISAPYSRAVSKKRKYRKKGKEE